MKRVWTLLLMVAMVLNVCAPVYAAEDDRISAEAISVSTSVEYLDNGDYIETVIAVVPSEAGLASYAAASSTAVTTSAKKTATYKNADGVSLWSVSVIGTFKYVPGVSVSCTGATASAETYSSSWKVGEATAAYSGNTATGTATGTRYWAFIPTEKITITATLKCDNNGNFS